MFPFCQRRRRKSSNVTYWKHSSYNGLKIAQFYLGAGASCPYGFPTGKELRKLIIVNNLVDCQSYLAAEGVEPIFADQELNRVKEFVDKFRDSSTQSIDLFLARNPEYSASGKRAIVFRILTAEHQSGFREETPYGDQDWYSWLYGQMTGELLKKEDYNRFCENDVSFITFNYDRSLEQFLYESLVNSFNGISANEITNQLKQIRICHVFGQVGPLEWQSQDGQCEYGKDVHDINVEVLRENIRIVHEEGESPELEVARALLSRADRVFFLGFGYAKENLDVLVIPEILTKGSRVYGTAMGFRQGEINRLKSLLHSQNSENRDVEIRDWDCLALLREFL